jgi:glycopeptide antibiotics resistance protein
LFCGALSFSIEVMQYCVPSRGSGITDIITNTLGAGLGAMLVQSRVVRDRLSRTGLVPTDTKVGATSPPALFKPTV